MRGIITQGLEELGLLPSLPPDAPAQLARYGQLLLEKNQMMNLTAIRDVEGVARLHMLDSAALLSRWDFQEKRLIDVGTGAGFPGLVLKILVPSLEVVLLDSLAKRLDWLEEVISTLKLTGVSTLHARAEEQALKNGFRDSFDFSTARAVSQMRLLGELCLPFVRPGGLFLAMKGPDSDGELIDAARCIALMGGRTEEIWDYQIPGISAQHRVAAIRKEVPTSKGYPRRWGKIQRDPL